MIYGKENPEHSGITIASNNKDKHKKICFKLRETIKKYSIYPLKN